jgi:hypothetical protein
MAAKRVVLVDWGSSFSLHTLFFFFRSGYVVIVLLFMIPHPRLDTLSSEVAHHSTAKVLLRHRWDRVSNRGSAGDNAVALSLRPASWAFCVALFLPAFFPF